MPLLHISVLVAGELHAVDAPVALATLFVRALGSQLHRPQWPRRQWRALSRRLRHDLDLMNALGALAMARAQAVSTCIAAADNQYAFASCEDRCRRIDGVTLIA